MRHWAGVYPTREAMAARIDERLASFDTGRVVHHDAPDACGDAARRFLAGEGFHTFDKLDPWHLPPAS